MTALNADHTRLQDIVANRLNVNRVLRRGVQPRLDGLESPFADIKTPLDRIAQSMKSFGAGDHTIKEC